MSSFSNPTEGAVFAAVQTLLEAATAPAGLVGQADALDPAASGDAAGTPIARVVLDAAALAGIAAGSVAASTQFTRDRPRARPLPGVDTATADPFSQTLLGEGHAEAQAAAALVRAAARELDGALAAGPLSDELIAALSARALSAFELAARVALVQGERVWEVVGTSGSARALGFEDAWTVARTVSLRHPRLERRQAIAESYFTWLRPHRDLVGA